MKKGFAPILILVGVLVVVALVAGAFYFGKSYSSKPANLTPSPSPLPPASSKPETPDKTANWKTYSGKSFEIKYPADKYELSVNKDNSNVIDIIPTNDFDNQEPLAVTYKILIVSFKNDNSLSISDPTNLFGSGPILQYTLSDVSKVKQTTISGMKAVRANDLPFGQAGIESEIYTIKDDTIFEIIVEPKQSSGDLDKNKPLYEQIISTFKFTG